MILVVNKKTMDFPDHITLREIILSQESNINSPEGILCVLNGILVNPPYDYILSDGDNILIMAIPSGG